MKKNSRNKALLNEKTYRRWGKIAKLNPLLVENFVHNKIFEQDEVDKDLEKDMDVDMPDMDADMPDMDADMPDMDADMPDMDDMDTDMPDMDDMDTEATGGEVEISGKEAESIGDVINILQQLQDMADESPNDMQELQEMSTSAAMEGYGSKGINEKSCSSVDEEIAEELAESFIRNLVKEERKRSINPDRLSRRLTKVLKNYVK